ncbi:phosphohistidine phosphatase SixA [Vibrio sp. ZSDZ65]|uniref:Phosphohistidine phosphatase SixA n=1 Tax=Vibrio qingdaonensis TaxID=2829491 RepID=A0A9X3CSD8_9VIBR|nr:phosphohistidine phosphatase SixA [Vibrio qingdaonensis]MCW8347610.1 phosphohistidine phosphatase SixA [Vibrio qingdaonensis]
MKVFIMRHGEAVHYAATDEERALTPHGELCSLSVARACKQQGFSSFDHVLVSPYLRAQQTWNRISEVFTAKKVTVCDDITPYGQAEDVAEYIGALSNVESLESILLVSHLPLVGYLTAELVGDMNAPMFPTSGLVCVEYDVERRQGELLWHLHP